MLRPSKFALHFEAILTSCVASSSPAVDRLPNLRWPQRETMARSNGGSSRSTTGATTGQGMQARRAPTSTSSRISPTEATKESSLLLPHAPHRRRFPQAVVLSETDGSSPAVRTLRSGSGSAGGWIQKLLWMGTQTPSGQYAYSPPRPATSSARTRPPSAAQTASCSLQAPRTAPSRSGPSLAHRSSHPRPPAPEEAWAVAEGTA